MYRITLILALFVGFLLPAPVSAQDGSSAQIGVHAGFESTNAVSVDVLGFVGLEARVHSENLPVIINPRVGYHFIETQKSTTLGVQTQVGGSVLQGGVAALYPFELESVIPYVGAGVIYSQLTIDASASAGNQGAEQSESDGVIGLLLNLGVEFGLTPQLSGFVQGEVITGGGSFEMYDTESEGSRFSLLTAGLLFSL